MVEVLDTRIVLEMVLLVSMRALEVTRISKWTKCWYSNEFQNGWISLRLVSIFLVGEQIFGYLRVSRVLNLLLIFLIRGRISGGLLNVITVVR